MPNYRLTIEYEGTRYRGWQEQKNARTVAGELRAAIEHVAGRIEDLGGSGRTDAGVHAAAQTAHLRMARTMDGQALRMAVNDRLPADIHVLSAAIAPERFHARHSAVSRSYVYQIAVRRTAFAKRFVWWVKRPLDIERMREAATAIPGRHDFVQFCEKPAEQTSTLVVVDGTEVAAAGGLILVRVVASHFLWRMVRRLVGGLVEVGGGDVDIETFRDLLSGSGQAPPNVRPALWTAPPSGLFLERALYPGDVALGQLQPIVPLPAEPEPFHVEDAGGAERTGREPGPGSVSGRGGPDSSARGRSAATRGVRGQHGLVPASRRAPRR